jgi:peptide deformylase
MLKLVAHTDPILLTPARPVSKVSKSIKQTVAEMFQVMYASDGIGLAAPQVGISLQIITIDIGNDPFVLINPKIVRKSAKTEQNIEGCLSFPGQYFAVDRSTNITVKAKDINNREFSFESSGLTAICIQHEYDHLQGITFDKIGTLVTLRNLS